MGISVVVSLIIAGSVAWYFGLKGGQFVFASVVAFPIALLALHYVMGFIWPFRVELREPTDFPVRYPDGPGA